MPTSAEFVARLLSQRGRPYSVARRFGPEMYDCSGLIHASLKAIGIDDRGAAGYTSRTFEDWTRAARTTIDVASAKQIAGALVFIGHQDGPGGHIAVSLGNGSIVEKPSAEGRKVGVSPFGRMRWDAAGLVPGLTYSGGVTPLPADAPATGATTDRSGALGAILDALDALTEPAFWLRVGTVIGGLVMIWAGFRVLGQDILPT